MREIPFIQKNSYSSLPFRIEVTNPHAERKFSQQISYALQSNPAPEIVCICIGTDRSTGDSLGPLVGTLLSRVNSPLQIYGTLDDPVHAVNLSATIEQIHRQHPQACILAIDACLGKVKSVGWIQVGLGPLRPGAGVNKNLPEIGQIYITGIVNVAGFMEYFVLQNTRLSMVMKMAEVISSSILEASYDLQNPSRTTIES
ncbi:spore protease YyaC [Hazenella coriacea]|uniref:Putative sporulation protein YyaC n=1 Tax=Hazenella coriacea TaxID=1179467 RepID=A0A4R3L8U1_9BACL|nr:spore protease YyaC [Hazenella coriacea]TCS95495.1 putative sporulation protein YyaC [Hazenella coriacea]